MNELGVICGAGFGESMQIAADSLYVLEDGQLNRFSWQVFQADVCRISFDEVQECTSEQNE